MDYQTLLVLRIFIVVALYLLVLQVVFVARRELRQEVKAVARGQTRGYEVIGHLKVIDPGSAPLQNSQEFEIEPITTLGRAKTNSIPIESGFVSVDHARITYREGSLWVEDTNSHNGVFVDGRKLEKQKPIAVSPGSILQIGDTRFRFTT
jgi:pSer/pThr/pTyr-binding forkhead associated (FHA) protein